jgi:hypothetical protein
MQWHETVCMKNIGQCIKIRLGYSYSRKNLFIKLWYIEKRHLKSNHALFCEFPPLESIKTHICTVWVLTIPYLNCLSTTNNTFCFFFSHTLQKYTIQIIWGIKILSLGPLIGVKLINLNSLSFQGWFGTFKCLCCIMVIYPTIPPLSVWKYHNHYYLTYTVKLIVFSTCFINKRRISMNLLC